jgi:hypothetical protein
MSLVQSAKLNGHDPWAYLKDVLTRLPTQLNSRIDELLPHNWRPAMINASGWSSRWADQPLTLQSQDHKRKFHAAKSALCSKRSRSLPQ